MSGKELLKVTRKGQVTIPKKYRDILNVKEGDMLYAFLEGERVILVKSGIPEPGEPVGEEKYMELIKLLEEERRKWR
ncbi:MAG: AbrB/MazE/SpoVT family DNA-binding domain-containing protein [Thermoproteota archaeon]|nr:AbrB/MazE/SpoVT family DNA-binding domain-containing protein [Candidatus Brockarchaeota archaeon]